MIAAAGTKERWNTAPASSHKPLIALTGATGFIGQHLLRELPKRGYRLRVLLRRPSETPIDCASALIGDLAKPYNMSEALTGVDAVIHSAGIAQTMSGVPEDDYRLLNTEATVKLARAAERAGVKRFVFLSSIRAQAGGTAERVLTEDLRRRRPTPMAAPSLPPSRGWPRPISTGSRSGSCSSMARACRAIWRGSPSLRARPIRCRSARCKATPLAAVARQSGRGGGQGAATRRAG